MRLVLVKGLDSNGSSADGQDLETCQPKPLTCQSVGWLVHDGNDCKVIDPHLTEKNYGVPCQGCGHMTIPTRAILQTINLGTPIAHPKQSTTKSN